MSEPNKRFPAWLFASIAVNVLLLGVVIGGAAGAWRQRAEHGDVARPNIERLAEGGRVFRTLSPEARTTLRRHAREAFVSSRDLRAEARAAREEVLTAATADPYDAERLRAAFTRMRAANMAMQAPWQNAVADAMGAMSVEERRRVVTVFARDRRFAMRAIEEDAREP